MLNKQNRGFAVAMLAMALGIPAAYAQPIDNAYPVEATTNQRASASGLTLSINDISTEVAVNLVCEHFGYTPMFHLPLPDIISVDLINASFNEAMERVLGNTQTDYMLENGRLHVFKPRESWSKISDKDGNGGNGGSQAPKAEPVITKIIPLGKRTAGDIQKLVKELNTHISVVQDVPTNSVIVMGPESQVVAIETLCKNIDGMDVKPVATDSGLIKGLRYITQTFELEHADFDEIEKELATIIERDTNKSGGGSGSSAANLRDKDGNPIETEYFILDKARRIVVIHTTMEKYAVIEAYFKAIDKPLPQVLIEASIVAIDDDLDKKLGVQWNGLDQQNATGYNGPQDLSPVSQSLTDHFKNGGTWSFGQVQALLRAVQEDTKSEILSKPRVITVTGKTSSIHVGDEIPYTSGQSVSDGGTTTSSVAFKEVGIKLDVTPTVNMKDQTIQLNVIPEVSQWVKDVVMGVNTVPQVSTRRTESTVKINNGDTMVIGGLIENERKEETYGVPLLSKIPVIGKVFQNKTKTNKKTNLIILLTAHIVDANHKNTVTSTAVKEINEIKPLKESQAIEEISQPTVDGPDVYGLNVEWPREEEKIDEKDGLPVSEPARTWTLRAEKEEKANDLKARKAAIEAQKQIEAVPATEEAVEMTEEEREQEEHLAIRRYLQNRLQEIRTNLGKENK